MSARLADDASGLKQLPEGDADLTDRPAPAPTGGECGYVMMCMWRGESVEGSVGLEPHSGSCPMGCNTPNPPAETHGYS